MEQKKEKCYENYPLSTILISNLLNIFICAIGFYIFLGFGLIYSIIYLLYVIVMEIRLLRKSCINCYYYGKCCAFGKGKLASLFFKKGNKKLSECKVGWKDLVLDFLVSLFPLIVGIVALIVHFSWLILTLVVALIIFSSFGNGFVRGNLACKYCKQRELGCPAEKLFDKTAKKNKMNLIKVKNYRELSEKAFQILSEEIKKKPNLVIGFASGKTPLELYRKLVGAYKKKKLDFSRVRAFNLDEYYPIKNRDKRSLYYYFFKNLFSRINVKSENINLLSGQTESPGEECRNYEENIRKNPIDIQILGVGSNGHIGFNEPGSEFNSKTRLVDLSKETVKVKKVTKKALTMGVSTIMKSKKILLLASGKKKAEAIKKLVKGNTEKKYPVSFLKKHKNLFVIVDEKAASLL